jgi:hypothetical protein
MTEEIFTELNFKRNDVTPQQSGHDKHFYYYTLTIGDVTIISNENDDADENGWFATIFDSNTLKIRGGGDLKELVNIITLNT